METEELIQLLMCICFCLLGLYLLLVIIKEIFNI